MVDLAGRPDPAVEAGRAWMRGDLPDREYFALVHREAYGPPWRERLIMRLRRR